MSWEPVVYRDIYATSLRLIIGGKDFTRFRGVPAQLGGYQLQEPYGYGPADFALPQVTGLEYTPSIGLPAEIRQLHEGAHVRLIPVTNGVRGRDLWRGFITRPQIVNGSLQIHCDGEASGKLNLTERQPALYYRRRDVGRYVFNTFAGHELPMFPRLGTETGEMRDNRGGGTSMLDWMNQLLASAVTKDGKQWTIKPTWRGRRHGYKLELKNTTDIHATVFYGSEGVDLDVTSDIAEKPTTWWGTGIDPTGQKWVNAVAPGLKQGEAAPYPFANGRTFGEGTTNADTDTGAGITALHSRLMGHGRMDRPEAGSVWDEETTEAVEEVQELKGLPVTGVMDRATWDAVFDLSTQGLSILQMRAMPLAQAPKVRRYDYTSSGAVAGRNPQFERRAIDVHRGVDHGSGVYKRDARQWTRRQRKLLSEREIWTGTLGLDGADVFEGDVTAATANPVPMSRLDLKQGMNVKVAGFDGDTVFHISGANVDADLNVRYAIDTHARDLLTVGQIIARRKESRRDPAREFLQSIRRPTAFDSMIVWSEIGGKLFEDVALTGGEWNVFEVVAGQSGTIERLRIQLEDAATEFVVGISALRVSPGYLQSTCGDPFAVDKDGNTVWAKPATQRKLKREKAMLLTKGQHDQPCGYSPGVKFGDKTDADGNPLRTDDPLTGEEEDDGGFQYHMQDGNPVLYVSIFPKADCVVKAGRIMWPLQTEGS